MKKTWMLKFGGLLLIFAMISGCQEKIAPELSTPASTTTGGGDPTSTSINRFFLTMNNTPTNVSPDDLGYVLHKTNSGAGVSCQVDDVVDTPEALDSTRDISCFMEAEEYALYYNGFELQANSDPNTCEYIVYEPFSYWNFPPGISARVNGNPRQVLRFNCSNETLAALGGAAMPGDFGNVSPTYTTLEDLCNRYFNLNDSGLALPLAFGQLHLDLPPNNPGADIPEDELCTYNHKLENGVVSCDEGVINIHEVNVIGIDTSNPADGILDVVQIAGSTPRELKCGGKVRNCIGGPAPDIVGQSEYVNGSIGMITQLSTQGGSTKMTVEESYPDRSSNYYSANFMRQCSGVPNYNAANSFTPLPGVEFDPSVMSGYTQVGVATTGLQEKDIRNLDVIPLADHAFRGGIPMNIIGTMAPNNPLRNYGVNRLATQPFYSFACLDHAFDIKARIKVAVREWNRNFSPSSQNFQFVSDVYNRALPYSSRTKMDAGSSVSLLEYPTSFDNDSTNDVIDLYFNNLMDWDDLLSFTNSPTGQCGSAINVDGTWLLTLDGTLDPLQYNPKAPYWFPRETDEN